MTRYPITTMREVRRRFWQEHPDLPREKIQNYSGNGTMFQTDTRCAFTDYIDALSKAGLISQDLAQRITLD